MPDGSFTDDPEKVGEAWSECEKFMQRILPNHKITQMGPGFTMCRFRKIDETYSVYENNIHFTNEVYLELVKNKNEIAKRLMEDL
jgi:hypothetical protein